MYLGKPVEYYQETSIDKVIFTKDMFISANENGVILGNYSIIKPYVSCYTNSRTYSGEHSLLFKTYAECNDTYFHLYKVDQKAIGDINEDDICVYSVYRDVYFW